MMINSIRESEKCENKYDLNCLIFWQKFNLNRDVNQWFKSANPAQMADLCNADNCCWQNKIMWQPPMEGEDMDEMGSGNEQQQQQSASVEKKQTEVSAVTEQSPAAEAKVSDDKVRWWMFL